MSVHGSVPSAVVSLVRKIEQVNIRGGNFYIDFEFVSLGRFREDESQIQRFPVEIAVRRLEGQVVIDTPIKYDKSIPEFLAGIPRTGSTANYSWAVMRKVYGQEEETFGESWDEVRHLLHDAGMEKDSYVVEWSNSGIDYSFLKMIMQQHIPSNSILLIHFWRTLLSGFSSMKLSYSYAFLYPDSSIHEHAHQASFDSLMFVEAMRALIDLAHRDDLELKNLVRANYGLMNRHFGCKSNWKWSMTRTTNPMMVKAGKTSTHSRLRLLTRRRLKQ